MTTLAKIFTARDYFEIVSKTLKVGQTLGHTIGQSYSNGEGASVKA